MYSCALSMLSNGRPLALAMWAWLSLAMSASPVPTPENAFNTLRIRDLTPQARPTNDTTRSSVLTHLRVELHFSQALFTVFGSSF